MYRPVLSLGNAADKFLKTKPSSINYPKANTKGPPKNLILRPKFRNLENWHKRCVIAPTIPPKKPGGGATLNKKCAKKGAIPTTPMPSKQPSCAKKRFGKPWSLNALVWSAANSGDGPTPIRLPNHWVNRSSHKPLMRGSMRPLSDRPLLKAL